MLWLPIRSCFYLCLYATWQVTRPLPPGAQCSVDTWRSEDRNNPGNSGNAKAEYNVLLTAQLFSTQKKEKVAKTTGNKICPDVGSVGEKEGFLRKLCKLHTFTIFFSFCYSASSRGHSDTGLYPLQGPATFLTFYFFKRLSISNANAATIMDKLCWKMPKTSNHNRNTYTMGVNNPIPPFNVGKW